DNDRDDECYARHMSSWTGAALRLIFSTVFAAVVGRQAGLWSNMPIHQFTNSPIDGPPVRCIHAVRFFRSCRRLLGRFTLAVAAFLTASTSLAAQLAEPSTPAAHQHHETNASTIELFPMRDASGTAWLPDQTPMFGSEHTWGGWNVMLMGVAFTPYLYEPGDVHRTGGFSTHQFVSTNWGMLMARRRVGTARVGLRAMMSVEPWTVPGCGYINFLATGEICEGDTIHDRQHPHDLFMELAADYDRRLRGSWRWQVYGGLAGEPALGPPAF